MGVKKLVIASVMSAEQAECLPLFDTIYSGVYIYIYIYLLLLAMIKFHSPISHLEMSCRAMQLM